MTSKTGYQRGLTDRERASIKERLAFEKKYVEDQREAEDREQYSIYLSTLNADERRPAFQLTPISFSEFRKLMDDSPDPVLRAASASYKSAVNLGWRNAQAMVKGVLSDENLQSLGFDLSSRPNDSTDVDGQELRKAYKEFQARNPDYDHGTHFQAVSDFIQRHRLKPSRLNIELGWFGISALALVPPKPEPKKPGVIEPAAPTAEEIKQKKRHDFYNKVVATDVTGQTYTEADLAAMSADDYRRLMLGEFRTPTVRDVIKPNLK